MQAHVELLIQLQSVELERIRLQQQLQKLPAEVAQAEATLAAAEKRAATATAGLSREEEARKKFDSEIAALRQKADRFRTQLDAVKTPAQAAAVEHEVQFSSSEADRLENEAFASLERSEALEAQLAVAQALVTEHTANLATIRRSVEARRVEFATELEARTAERAALRPGIAEELLTRFDRLVAKIGTGIASAENQQCAGCRMGVRPQMWNQLREGELLTCDSCGRMLYWSPAFAPVAKEDRPAAVPGAGRAVRKPKPA
jgi:hypothetical protein